MGFTVTGKRKANQLKQLAFVSLTDHNYPPPLPTESPKSTPKSSIVNTHTPRDILTRDSIRSANKEKQGNNWFTLLLVLGLTVALSY